MARKDENMKEEKTRQHLSQAPLPTVGEPLDGRHFLDVLEEQQYAGKPFVPEEQEVALEKGAPPHQQKKEDGNGKPG